MSSLKRFIDCASERKQRFSSTERNQTPKTSQIKSQTPRVQIEHSAITDFISVDGPTTKHINIGLAYCSIISSICPNTFIEKSWYAVRKYLLNNSKIPNITLIDSKTYHAIKNQYLAGSDIKDGLTHSADVILKEIMAIEANSNQSVSPSPVHVVSLKSSPTQKQDKYSTTKKTLNKSEFLANDKSGKQDALNFVFKLQTNPKDCPTKRLICYKNKVMSERKSTLNSTMEAMFKQLNSDFPLK